MSAPDLDSRIMAALAGASAQQPMCIAALRDRLGLTHPEIMDALCGLYNSRAINQATVTTGDAPVTVVWPTGMSPQPVGSRAFTIGGHTAAYAAAKALKPRGKNAPDSATQASPAAAAKSRRIARAATAVLAGETPAHQENAMPRITAPAVPRAETPAKGTPDSYAAKADYDSAATSTAPARPMKKAGNGAVQSEIMAALRGAGRAEALSVSALAELVPSAGSLDSLATTARLMARKGVLDGVSVVIGGQRKTVYWDAQVQDPGQLAGAGKPIAAPALNDGHEKNLDLVRRLAADDAAPPAYESPLPAIAEAQARIARAIGAPVRPNPERASFAYYDDGALEIFQGEETVILPAPQVSRLVAFLARIVA